MIQNAFEEINQLANVHDWVEEKLETSNIMIAGDLNAGGTFVKQSDWRNCKLRRADSGGQLRYRWLIADHVDTTATNTLAAYDRLIVCGDAMSQSVVPDSAGVFRFDEEFELDERTALKVSDHFPVYCHLRPSVHPTILKNIQTRLSLIVVDKRLPNLDFNELISSFKVPKLKVTGLYSKEGELNLVEVTSRKLKNLAEVTSVLTKLRETYPQLISFSSLTTIKYKLSHMSAELQSSEEFFLTCTFDLSQSKTSKIEVQMRTDVT